MPHYKVIGICTIAGKKRGEVVELDPEQVNISALIAAGHVEAIEKPAEKPSTKAATK